MNFQSPKKEAAAKPVANKQAKKSQSPQGSPKKEKQNAPPTMEELMSMVQIFLIDFFEKKIDNSINL